MELFTQLFGDLLAFVYHCFDRIVIYLIAGEGLHPGPAVRWLRTSLLTTGTPTT